MSTESTASAEPEHSRILIVADDLTGGNACGALFAEAGLRTILVRTGISDDAEISRYPFRPTSVVESVADLVEHIRDPFGDGFYADEE